MTFQLEGKVRDESGRGIEQVAVSNGEDIVTTDGKGRYQLGIDPGSHSFVMVTVPAGYGAPEAFYRSASGPDVEADFAITSRPERAQRRFSLAQFTDTHVVTEDDTPTPGIMLPFDATFAGDLASLEADAGPDLIVGTGDLTETGTVDQLRRWDAARRSIPVPVFPVFGRHDGREEFTAAPPDWTSTRNYESVLGPTYYSFDRGGRHFVVYASEDTCFSQADRQRKERWLHQDLSMQPRDTDILFIQHTPPDAVLFEKLAAFNVVLFLHGHSHSSKVFKHEGCDVSSVTSLCFGAIDGHPRGYRLVRFTEDGFELELRPLQEEASERSVRRPATSPGVVWETELPSTTHRATPVPYNGDLLVSLQDEDGRGRAGVYCIDAESAIPRWHFRTDSSVKSSVGVGDEGKAVAVSITGRVYCLDSVQGKELWNAELPGYPYRWFQAEPVVRDGVAYVGSMPGLAAYDVPTGSRLWHTPLADSEGWSAYSGPVIFEDLVINFVPSRGVLGVGRDNGAIVWETALGETKMKAPSPVLASGGRVVSGGAPGCLAVLDARSGDIVWHEQMLDPEYFTGLAVRDESIFASTTGGEVLCLSLHTGEQRWSFSTGPDLLDMTPYLRGQRSIMAAPVFYGDRLVVCGLDGGIYLLDPVSGELSASYSLGAPISASPCTVDGGLCVGTWDGRLYRLAL